MRFMLAPFTSLIALLACEACDAGGPPSVDPQPPAAAAPPTRDSAAVPAGLESRPTGSGHGNGSGLHASVRIVVFKDPILSKAQPEWSIRTPDGELWIDRAGNSWVSSWEPAVWHYNIDIAAEVIEAGFDEVRFDSMRFPEAYASLPAQVHSRATGSRTGAIVAFLRAATQPSHPLGGVGAADVFDPSPPGGGSRP